MLKSRLTWIGALALVALPVAASAQAIAESAVGAARSGAAGAPGKNVSKSITGVFSNVAKTLETAAEAKPASAAPAPPKPVAAAKMKADAVEPARSEAAAKPAEPPAPAVTYEDPAGIKTGMERSELVSRFGEPSMKVVTGAGRASLTYEVNDRRVEVELRDGKVTSIQSRVKPKQATAVVLQ